MSRLGLVYTIWLKGGIYPIYIAIQLSRQHLHEMKYNQSSGSPSVFRPLPHRKQAEMGTVCSILALGSFPVRKGKGKICIKIRVWEEAFGLWRLAGLASSPQIDKKGG